MEAAVPKFEHGRYASLFASPLRNHPFEPPDVVVVFGNSAQVMRLVQAALYHQGGYLTSSFGGRLESIGKRKPLFIPSHTPASAQPMAHCFCWGTRLEWAAPPALAAAGQCHSKMGVGVSSQEVSSSCE